MPGDSLLLESNALFVDEATLTGETYPWEKEVGLLPAGNPPRQTHQLVIHGHSRGERHCRRRGGPYGPGTRSSAGSPSACGCAQPSEFEHGVRRFGHFLLEVTLVVLGIFAVNVYLHRPVLDSFLFSMALAVGLTPQLLPAIISINLAHGARRMAQEKVIVKRLAAIENLGSMNVSAPTRPEP